jgi:hypothetical protein
MIRALVPIALVLSLGASIAAALYWALLNTPDSNVLMLAASALLSISIVAVAAFTLAGAVAAARDGSWSRSVMRYALSAVPWFLLSLVLIVLIVWLTNRAEGWLESRSGEINAWFIARFGWADVSGLIMVATWALAWLRWVVGPWLGLTLFAAALEHSRHDGLVRAWLRDACDVRPLLLATFWFVVLVALPWRLAFWRPMGLPPTWIEPAAAGLRLFVMSLLMLTGLALIIRTAVRPRPRIPEQAQSST